jgi:hypothetical protein
MEGVRNLQHTFHGNDPKTGKGSIFTKYDMQKIYRGYLERTSCVGLMSRPST